MIWKGREDIKKVAVFGEAFGFNTSENQLERLLDTDLWFRTYKARRDSRSFYIFFINEPDNDDVPFDELDTRIDPFNSNKYICITDEKYPDEPYLMKKEESLVEMPDFIENIWVKERKDNKKGRIEMINFKSEILDNERRIWIYTPYNYSKDREPYNLAIFTDGWEYLNVAKAPEILDNLIIEKKIPSTCSVFIETHEERDIELTCNEAFLEFLTKEIYPWMHEKYNITNEPSKTIMAGFSYGGITAAYAGLKHSELFGKILSQSGAYYWSPEDYGKVDWLVDQYEMMDKLPLDYYMSLGIYEFSYEDHYKANLRMEKVLKEKGYKVSYEEFPGGHNSYDLQFTLANGIINLIGQSE